MGRSVSQKGLAPKLSFSDDCKYLYTMPWSLGALTDRDCDQERVLRRKSCQENSEGNGRQKCWREAKGPHNPVKPQSAMRCDKGGRWDSQHPYAPAAGAIPQGDRFTTTQRGPEAVSSSLAEHRANKHKGDTAYSAAQAGGGRDPPPHEHQEALPEQCPEQGGRQGNLNKQGPSDGNFKLKATIWRKII